MVKYHSKLGWRPALKCMDIANIADSQLYTPQTQDYLTKLSAFYYELTQYSSIVSAEQQIELSSETESEDLLPLDLSSKSMTSKSIFTMDSQGQSSSSTISTMDLATDYTDDLPLDLRLKPEEDASREVTSSPSAAECNFSPRFHCNPNSQCLSNRNVILHKANTYKCYMCKKTYRQARDYRAHIAAHKNSSTYKCDICTCVLSNSLDYLQHLKEHKQKDLHCCTHCGKYFRDGCTLTTHVRTHTGEKPYKCEICNKQFRQSGTYRRHKKLHSPRNDDR